MRVGGRKAPLESLLAYHKVVLGWKEPRVKKPCRICGTLFVPRSNRQKYCPVCRKEKREEVKRRGKNRAVDKAPREE